MRHLGEKRKGEVLVIEGVGFPPPFPLDSGAEAPKYEIIGIGPDFYGTVADDTLVIEEGVPRGSIVIGDWGAGTYLIRVSQLGADGWVHEESLLTISTQPATDEARGGSGQPTLAPFLKGMEVVDFVPYEDESQPFTFEIEGDELVIRPVEGMLENHTYSVYLGPEARFEGGFALDGWVRADFDTKASPLYVSRGEVMRELGIFKKHFAEREVISAIRQAGLKAHQLQRLPSNVYDVREFETLEEDEDNYYPTTRFVLYETLSRLADEVYGLLMYGDGGLVDTLSQSYSLADLQIQGSRDDGAARAVEMTKLLKNRISGWNGEVAYWRDAMLNRNARGYARAKTAAYRSEAGSPEDRTI